MPIGRTFAASELQRAAATAAAAAAPYHPTRSNCFEFARQLLRNLGAKDIDVARALGPWDVASRMGGVLQTQMGATIVTQFVGSPDQDVRPHAVVLPATPSAGSSSRSSPAASSMASPVRPRGLLYLFTSPM